MATTATHAHTSTENQSMSYRFALPQQLRTAVDKAAADWQSNNKVDRFWKKDPTLWTQDGEEKWLGWINIVEREQKEAAAHAALAQDIRGAGFESALLLGMGGSSLCPEVLAVTFGRQPGFPALHIVDSTDPAQIKAAQSKVDLAKTIAVVGLSRNPLRPSHGVSAYMQSHGYRIIPVNPQIDESLGEKAYASLSDVPEKIDIVDIFRRPEFVEAVVDQAIKLKIPAIWMQEEVVHEKAAEKARKAGIFVVMDRCILKEHRDRFR